MNILNLSPADQRVIREALLRLRDQTDLAAVANRCQRLADTFGEALAPADLLDEVARHARKNGVVLPPETTGK